MGKLVAPTITPFNTGVVRGVHVKYPGTPGYVSGSGYPNFIVDLSSAYDGGWINQIGSIEMWADINFHWMIRDRAGLMKVFPYQYNILQPFASKSRQIDLVCMTTFGGGAFADRFDMTIYEQILPSYSSPAILTP